MANISGVMSLPECGLDIKGRIMSDQDRILVSCTHCGHRNATRRKNIGMLGRCKNCGQLGVVYEAQEWISRQTEAVETGNNTAEG